MKGGERGGDGVLAGGVDIGFVYVDDVRGRLSEDQEGQRHQLACAVALLGQDRQRVPRLEKNHNVLQQRLRRVRRGADSEGLLS
jgi:hypothetical protein